MSPRPLPPRTEKDEKTLTKAVEKATRQGKEQAAKDSVGWKLRQAGKENA